MKQSILPTIRLFLLVAAILAGTLLSFTKSEAQESPLTLKVEIAPVLYVFWDEANSQPDFLTNTPEQTFEVDQEKNDQEITFSVVANL